MTATKEEKLEVFYLPSGTIVKINGLPFELAVNTPIKGVKENIEMVSILESEK